MKDKVVSIITDSLKELNEEFNVDQLKDPTLETRLYGAKSGIDSLQLVTVISEVEMNVADDFDCDIALADDRAMSQRRSPFRTVESLADYIVTLLEEEQAENAS